MSDEGTKDEKIARAWQRLQDAADGGERAAPKALERPSAKIDGRRARATGRNQQLNLKISATAKSEFIALAISRGITQGELFELMLTAWRAANDGST